MGAITVDGLEFDGRLETSIMQCFPEPEYRRRGVVEGPWKYSFGVTRSSPEKIWFGAPRILFDGTISINGNIAPGEWKVGILQSISQAEWVGHYSNREAAYYRVNPVRRLVNDHDEDSSIFFRYPCELGRGSANVHEAKIVPSAHDRPSVAFLSMFSGNAYKPEDASD
jgi:hypothetical protein